MRRVSPLLLVAALIVLACGRKVEKPAVAKGGGVVVTAEEFRGKLNEMAPAVRARFATLDKKKELLEPMIRFELLVQEAQRRGLDQDPEVQRTIKQLLVQRLMRSVEQDEVPVSEADLQAYYDAHVSEFAKPERVRVGLVLLRAPAGAPERLAKAAEAKKLRGRLAIEDPKSASAFSSAARAASDDAQTKAAGGDTGLRTMAELAHQYGSAIAIAAKGLDKVGEIPEVVETPEGFAILKLLGREASPTPPLAEVRSQVVARVKRQAHGKEFEALVKKLRDGVSVKIDEGELEGIAVGTFE